MTDRARVLMARAFGPLHLAGYGDAPWHPPEGLFTYGEFTMVDIAMKWSDARR